MANQNPEKWLLTHEERARTRSTGLDAYLASKLGVEPSTVQIISARNEHLETAEGLIGCMIVRLDWHSPDQRWHMRNLRFNGQRPEGLEDMPKEFETLLGSFAIAREVDYRDYSRNAYGLPVGGAVRAEPAPTNPEPELPQSDQPATDDRVLAVA